MARVTGESRIIGSPRWAKDFGSRDRQIPVPMRVDPLQFTDASGVTVTANGASDLAATSVAVDALTGPIPHGTALRFSDTQFAFLTADAAAGDTTLTVAALPAALVGGETAAYSRFGTEYIPSGSYIGRTYAEAATNDPFGPAIATDDERYLLLFDIYNANIEPDAEGYRHGGVVAFNHLPAAEQARINADADLLAAIRADYVCIVAED